MLNKVKISAGERLHMHAQCAFIVCMFVCEREMEGDRVCVHVRGEAERECQHCV